MIIEPPNHVKPPHKLHGDSPPTMPMRASPESRLHWSSSSIVRNELGGEGPSGAPQGTISASSDGVLRQSMNIIVVPWGDGTDGVSSASAGVLEVGGRAFCLGPLHLIQA